MTVDLKMLPAFARLCSIQSKFSGAPCNLHSGHDDEMHKGLHGTFLNDEQYLLHARRQVEVRRFALFMARQRISLSKKEGRP